MQIGPYQLDNPVIAAPMAGITDKPYREMCRQFGAGMVVSEMVSSRMDLRHTTKSKFRHKISTEIEPVVIQLVGTEPAVLAEAAQFNVDSGAQIIDINMGCPAKKVCQKAAGSALLADEPLVARILSRVVNAVDVPVTVKIRTGTSLEHRNATQIARIAEDCGIQAITIHGRTRACKFIGEVEYDTIRQVKQLVSIPVTANGDINSPEKAQAVLNETKADAVMIGRAAQGQPWLFDQIAHFLATGESSPIPDIETRAKTILHHIKEVHEFYGDRLGVKLARKHIKWYLANWEQECPADLRRKISTHEDAATQLRLLEQFIWQSCEQLAA